MRRLLALVSFLCLTGGLISAEDADPRIAEALERTTEAATHYQFQLTGDAPETLEFHSNSLLHWSNPVIGVIYGNVFVWTKNGRPEVIGSILQWYEPHKHSTHEFHSLSNERVVGLHDGRQVWATQQPGLTWAKVPNAPVVGESKLVRQRQLRAIARQFQISSVDKEDAPYNLRLLSQPLFRYGDAKSKVLDGALFSFVQGTDPEVILLIEAEKNEEGTLEWRFALSRMAALEFSAELQGREVWRVEAMPYRAAMKGREPYSLFRFHPSKAKGK